jgi:hypothetical protein
VPTPSKIAHAIRRWWLRRRIAKLTYGVLNRHARWESRRLAIAVTTPMKPETHSDATGLQAP